MQGLPAAQAQTARRQRARQDPSFEARALALQQEDARQEAGMPAIGTVPEESFTYAGMDYHRAQLGPQWPCGLAELSGSWVQQET